MKNSKLAAILYYMVLIGGFLFTLGIGIIGDMFFGEEIQSLSENFPFYVIIPIPIIWFLGYVYTIKKIVETKAFKEWEDETKRKAERNKKRNKKIFKVIILCLGIFVVIHFVLSIVLIIASRNGYELNSFLEIFSEMPVASVIFFIGSMYYYNENFKDR